MKIEYLQTKRQFKKFKNFIKDLYRGDKCYVSTAEFVLDSVLYRQTEFSRSCETFPIAIVENNNTKAQAIFIYNKKLPYFQIGFFDALKDCEDAVELLVLEAKKLAKERGLSEIIVGLNAHISYGVGILTEGFDFKNSFDSIYNKPYYKDYFQSYKRIGLSTYRSERKLAELKVLKDKSRITVCEADFKDFYGETEKMRLLCEQTIAKTYLYYPTEKGHFFELMKDLKPFLSNENLLFAKNEKGELVGFLFWHPDFNRIIPAGKHNSLLSIALKFAFKSKKIDTLKINAIGALSQRATCALIEKLAEITKDRFLYAETNFVWDNNAKSTMLNNRFFGSPHRKYEVFVIDV